MPSDRQLKPNCTNTAAGTAVLPGEDAEAFRKLRADLLEEYQPATATELVLVEEFAQCSWRLLRLRRVETQMWSGYILAKRVREGEDRNPSQIQSDRGLAATLAETPPSELTNYFRYERTTTRDFYRVLEKLEALQRQRRRAQPISTREVSANGIGTVSPPLPRETSAAGESHVNRQCGSSSRGEGVCYEQHGSASRDVRSHSGAHRPQAAGIG